MKPLHVTCPYCEHQHEQPMHLERQVTLGRCPECDCAFQYRWEMVKAIERRADCLNGGQHDWEQGYGDREGWGWIPRCRICQAPRPKPPKPAEETVAEEKS